MPGESRDEDKATIGSRKVGDDAALDAFGHRHRRTLLHHLANVDSPVDVTEAAQAIAASDARADPDDLRFDLHHLHLPKLEGFGLVEFDDERKEIHYRQNLRVETLLETIDERW